MDQGQIKGADNRPPPDADIARAEKTVAQFMTGQGMAGGVTLEKPDGEKATAPRAATGEGRKYTIGRVFAQGGMGAILHARDLDIRRIVAMKVMRDAKGAPQERLLRFIEEAQITGQLEHPNIVPVHELGVDAQDSPFYTMKLVRGRTLKQVLDDLREHKPAALARYPLNTLLNVFLKVCDAVAFAHSRGVIHRDLKPENIMLGDYGEVLVMDWGLAKIVKTGEVRSQKSESRSQNSEAAIDSVRFDEGGDALTTLEGQAMGTPSFMSPEQAMGKGEAVGPASDVYTLGAILYSLLTLEPPVNGKTAQEVLLKVVRGQVTTPTVLNRAQSAAAVHKAVGGVDAAPVHSPRDLQRRVAQAALDRYAAPKRQGPFPHCPGGQIPEALSAVTMKAMACQPQERYASVAELQAEIEKFQAGFATSAEEAGALKQAWLLAMRHKGVCSVTTAALLLLAVIVSVAFVRVTQEKRLAVQAKDQALDKERQAVAARAELQSVSRQAAPEFVTKALRLLDTPEWAQALPVATNATVLDPDFAEAWVMKGRLHLALGELKEAETAFARPASDAQARRYREAIRWACSAVQRGATDPEVRVLERLAETLPTSCSDSWAAVKVAESARVRAHATAPDAKQLDLRLAAATEGLLRRNPGLPTGVQWFEKKDGALSFNGHKGGKALRDLTPLQGLPLSEVNVGSTAVTDLSPLRGMPLRMLDIRGTAVRDLEPLRGMPLEQLEADTTQVWDLTPLRGMPLKRLALRLCPIRDIAPLAGLPIEELDLTRTQVRDFAPLASLPLRSLRVTGTSATRLSLKDLSLLQGKRIEYLDIGFTQVTDLAPLRGMPLKYLGLGGCRIADLTPLRDLPLEGLDLSSTGIKDLTPLASLKLKTLNVRANGGVVDLMPLRQMPLEELSAEGIPISSLECLRGMNTLRKLYVSGRGIRDLAPLQGLALTHLQINSTSVDDLRPLAGMPLGQLRMEKTNVSDLSPLKGMKLAEITFKNTQVRDLSPLKGMPLGFLSADGCPVRDLEPLRGMSLTLLTLTDCREIADVSPLKEALLPGGVWLGIPTGLPPAQMAIIRGLRNVTVLADNQADWGRSQSPAEFWRKYDARLAAEAAGGK